MLQVVFRQLFGHRCCIPGCRLSSKQCSDDPITLTQINHGHIPHGAFMGLMAIHNLCLMGRHSLRNGTYMSRALLLQLGLMWLWSNKYCHRVPRDDLQMVLAAWYLSLSLIFFFFHPSSPSRLCLASWP